MTIENKSEIDLETALLESTTENKFKINRETALLEFDRFSESMDLDLDADQMDAEDLTQFNKQKSKVVRAIEKGCLVINDNGEAVYTPQNKKSRYDQPITFHERTGASLMAMDGKKKNYDVAKTYAVMGDMCKLPPKVFAGLMGIDVKICEALFAFLMD